MIVLGLVPIEFEAYMNGLRKILRGIYSFETKNEWNPPPYLFLGGFDQKIFHSEAQVVRH